MVLTWTPYFEMTLWADGSYTYSEANGRLDGTYALVNSTAVPVPATFALVGIGFVGLGWSRRKKA